MWTGPAARARCYRRHRRRRCRRRRLQRRRRRRRLVCHVVVRDVRLLPITCVASPSQPCLASPRLVVGWLGWIGLADVMKHPVTTPFGHTYERHAVLEWIKKCYT